MNKKWKHIALRKGVFDKCVELESKDKQFITNKF